MRPTYLTINTSLVRENLRKIKDSLPEWSTSTAVIKANGYGHGSVMMGRRGRLRILSRCYSGRVCTSSQCRYYGAYLSIRSHKATIF